MKLLYKGKLTAISDVIKGEVEAMVALPEVTINNYAVFMGYLSLAVRGLGYLVITWTTVVLLGGFVSMLNEKDFWSLTVITLVQIIRALDVSGNERLSYIGYSFLGLLVSMSPPRSAEEVTTATVVAAVAATFAAVVQVLVFVLVLCPLGAAYMFGPVISTGVSMWRLIQQDYVDALDTDPNKKNLRPSLNVLYSLALLQGGLFLYRAIYSTRGKAITNFVIKRYKLDDQARLAVTDYFRETRVGLEKDPSFARGWNLFMYAVDMLESRSPDRYLYGARLLDTLLPRPINVDNVELPKQLLLGSPSAGNVVSKLLWTLDSARPYGQEAREHAATIVEFLAGELHLEQFPRGLRRIESLLEDSNLKLKQKGVSILSALAADEDNRRAMSDMPSLFPKVVAVVNNVLVQHQSIGDNKDEHSTWVVVARPALHHLLNLMDSLGESGAKLRQGSSMAISASTMENIIKCNMCHPEVKEAAMKILQDLPGDEAEAIRNHIASNMNNDEVVVPIDQAEIEEGGC